MTLQCMKLREKNLLRRNNRLAIIMSAEIERFTIEPNKEINISGYFDKQVPYHPVCALLQPTVKSVIPSLIPYKYNELSTSSVKVIITNPTTKTMTISPHTILCEIQPIHIENINCQTEELKPQTEKKEVMDQITICTDGLTNEQIAKGQKLINKFSDIMSKDDLDIGHTTMVKHRIEPVDGTPFKQKHRRIPPSMYDEVRDHLHLLLASGIIRKSFSPWTSNVVLFRKKDDKLRICVDYRQLNDRTIKDAHALPRIEEILDGLAGNKYFTEIDMKSG